MRTSDTYPMAPIPEPVARVGELMSTYGASWALCGGWAVDAWLGRETREHGDVDIAVFQDDLPLFLNHLDGWQLVAHDDNVPDDTAEPWNGRKIDIPGHIHARAPEAHDRMPDNLDDPAGAGFGLDIQICERSADDWVLNRNPDITLPLHRCIEPSAWGLPTALPEVLLFYKASEPRRRDKLDLLALLPHLTGEQRDWLRNAISLTGHPWLAHLSA
jgi:hypothetical protein